jgi:hypothetical protein
MTSHGDSRLTPHTGRTQASLIAPSRPNILETYFLDSSPGAHFLDSVSEDGQGGTQSTKSANWSTIVSLELRTMLRH